MRSIDPLGSEDEGTGWRRARGLPSMSEVHGSISVTGHNTNWRKAAAFFGPGYLVAVGYMDPGNWATSIAGGSQFGYALLFVILLSSMMAMILQALAARLAVATGRDLAQACRDAYPAPVAFVLWILAEIAIAATDLAEVIGTAIGLNLLFGIPLEIGVVLTALDVFLVLWLQTRGFRFVEALVITLLGVIAVSFLLQLILARPDIAGVVAGFAPSTELIHNPDMLYIALGIIGATVMPHNLYLHSGAVQTRAIGKDAKSKREAIRFTTIDSNIALLFALVVNASILVLAGSAFNARGEHEVVELDKAYALLHPLLGSTLAPTLFAIALLCCGLNSTVTATMAGQIVMEGFINIRLSPWLRRLITRGLAIVPAVIVTILYGASGTGKLLILSQVILSLQLPFAVVPLVMFTAERSKMGAFVAPRWLSIIAAVTAAVIIILNMKLLYDVATG